MSYPWFWDYTRARPKGADLAGTYGVLKVRLPENLSTEVRARQSLQILKADHTVAFRDFPIFDGFGDSLVCRLSGTANWSLNHFNSNVSWSIDFEKFHPIAKSDTKDCDYERTTWEILLLGQKPPYRLYTTVGDPDSDTGIEFGRTNP
jgi:hypothetical protein